MCSARMFAHHLSLLFRHRVLALFFFYTVPRTLLHHGHSGPAQSNFIETEGGLRVGATTLLAPAPPAHHLGTRKSAPKRNQSTECVTCHDSIAPYDNDYIKGVNQCRKFHRECVENWCGKPCLCKGLLCKIFPAPGWGRFPNFRNICANCFDPAYPQTQNATNRSGSWYSAR